MNIIRLPLVLLLATTVSACDMTSTDTNSDEKPSQRDVYRSLEDCVADWGDTELCERQIADAKKEAEKLAAQSGSGSHVSFVPIFFGPSYSPGDRSVYTQTGQRYSPATTRATSTATYLRNARTGVISPKPPIISRPATPTPHSSIVSRGGFGATGRGVSSGG